MKKTIGSYTIKLNGNTCMITIEKDNMTIKGIQCKPDETTSKFHQVCEMVAKSI